MNEIDNYDDAVELIRDTLSLAGQDRRSLEMLARAGTMRITRKTVIPEQKFLFRMYGKPCFPRNELVAITGKAKSGKTFVSSILMALSFRSEALRLERIDRMGREGKGMRVLWFDTEQSAESTQDILRNRIIPMICADEMDPTGSLAGNPAMEYALDEIEERLEVYNARTMMWQERLPMFEALVRRSRPDLVILDGIRDLMEDINDGRESQRIVEALMSLASETGCCMVCVLHQNKAAEDKNLRGCIGTELKNKAFEAYECTKDENRIFTFRQTDTRKYDIVERLQYVVGGKGIPHLWTPMEGEVDVVRKGGRKGAKESAREKRETEGCLRCEVRESDDEVERKEEVMEAFRKSFRGGTDSKTYKAVMGAVMRMTGMRSAQEYRMYREEAERLGVIRRLSDDEFVIGDSS